MPFFINLLVSSSLGLLSGLGIGGGSLLIIWLTLICEMDYPAAKYINLLFFIPPALITAIIYLLRKRSHFCRILPAILSGCIAAAGFTILSSGWNTLILRKLFGGLLLLAALRELKYKKQQKDS